MVERFFVLFKRVSSCEVEYMVSLFEIEVSSHHTVRYPIDNETGRPLLPFDVRKKILDELNGIHKEQADVSQHTTLYTLDVKGEINPKCKFFYDKLLEKYNGDWTQVLSNHVEVIRKNYNEAKRVGIASFQPKDEKNQDFFI